MTVTRNAIWTQVLQTLNEQAAHHDVNGIVSDLIERYDVLGDAPTVSFEDIKDYWSIVEQRRLAPSTHWHAEIAVPGLDTELFVGSTIFDALEYASNELSNLADWLHSGITVAGDAGLYKLAYDRFQLTHTYWQLAEDAKAVVEQYHLLGAPNAEVLAAAQATVDAINAGTPKGLTVHECPLDECAPTTEGGS